MGRSYMPTTSFSGADMLIYFVFPEARPVYIGTASTVTYSTFREIRHVRTLGRISAKGVTRGPRTIGGTIIFTVINQHVVNDILDALKSVTLYQNYDKIKPDELPPFDIIVVFGNEYGQSASKVIYGATIVDDGMALSIEDLFTENQMTYIARDIDHMRDLNKTSQPTFSSYSYNFRGAVEAVGKFTITKVDSTASYTEYLRQVKQMHQKYRN